MYRVINALGIDLVGKITAKKLASVNGINNFINGTINYNIQLGDIVKNNLDTYFKANPTKIADLSKLFNITNAENVIKSNKLMGKTFCISGQLPSGYTKDKLEKRIKENGGIMVSGVSQHTSYLICEDKSFKKAQKAQKYGVPIISVKEFLELVKGA
jgi:DNA ligase (NAD+)